MTSHALIDALADRTLHLTIEPAPRATRMPDPTVVAASIDPGALPTLIGGLVALAARHERSKVIIQGASGDRLAVPATATQEEVEAFTDAARELDVVHLHVSGSRR